MVSEFFINAMHTFEVMSQLDFRRILAGETATFASVIKFSAPAAKMLPRAHRSQTNSITIYTQMLKCSEIRSLSPLGEITLSVLLEPNSAPSGLCNL